jgi:integrase
MAAYQAALGEPAPMSASWQGPGTVGALVCDYLKSPAYSNLKPASQRAYRAVLDRFATLHGHRRVSDMPRAKVAAYIHTIGAERPAMANLAKAVLRKLLAHGVRIGYRNDNPITEIDRYKHGTRHTWSEAELAAYERRWPLGTRERLAYALLLYTGQRGGDVVKMRRADISGGAIAVVQQKTGTALSIPIHPDLAAAMKSGPANGLTLLGDKHGRPMQRGTLTLLMQGSGEGWLATGMRAAWVAQGSMSAAGRMRSFGQANCRGVRSQNHARNREVHGRGRPKEAF